MKKNLMAILLALALCLCAASACADEGAALPAVGDSIGVFKVTEIMPMDVLGATGVLFEHEKNGAQLLYLASSDTNVSFDITFRTPALDDKGKPHVFEHITICGSQRYPDANLFFPFSNRTYNTYVNASTYSTMTTYPLSSLSEEQLFVMADYYLSGVFEPLLLTEPKLAQREAWRYELNDVNEPLNIAGTVYSEMQGSLTPAREASYNHLSNMFKDGLTAHVSGGRPEAIRTLTYDELVAFHDEYYHPSNSLIILYGKLDYEKFIRYIDDEYISKYDRKDVYIESGRVEPYTETAYAEYESAVGKDASTDDASFISYSIAFDGMSLSDVTDMIVLSAVLDSDALPVMQLLNERLPGVDVDCYMEAETPVPMLTFDALSANPEDRDTFVAAIDEGIASIIENGIAEDALASILSGAKLGLMLTANDSNLGVNSSMEIALLWQSYGTVDYYIEYERAFNEATTDSLMALMKKYIVGNTYRGVTVTKPAPGKLEENAAILADELAQKKASMTDAELADMVEQTKSFAEWSSAPVSSEIMSRLAIITPDKLPETVNEGKVTDETIDGVRYITSEAEVSDIAELAMYMDASSVPSELLRDAQAFMKLCGSVSTTRHTREELSVLTEQLLGQHYFGMNSMASYIDNSEDIYCAQVRTLNLAEYADEGLELIGEILYETDLGNIAEIKSILSIVANDIRHSFDTSPLNLQLYRCQAMYSDVEAFYNQVSGVNMLERLDELIAMADADPEGLTACLSEARDAILNRANLRVVCAGSPDAIDAYIKAADKLIARLPAKDAAPVDRSPLRPEKENEALVNSLTVHMNTALLPSFDFTGKLIPISSYVENEYLLPQLRNAMGAYGAYSSLGTMYFALYTYRDPNLASTFEVYEALPDFLRSAEPTQEDLDSYIVGSYGSLLMNEGKLSQAITSATYRLLGLDSERQLKWMREAKATTAEDVRAAADIYEKLVNEGVRSTSGAEATLEGSEDMFTRLIRADKQAE